MKTIKALLSITLFLLIISCDSSSDEPNVEPQPKEQKTSLPVAEIDSEMSLTIHATGKWTVTTYPDWCDIYPLNGDGTETINIDIQANLQGENRKGDIIVKADKDKDMVYELNQPAANVSDDYLTYKLPIIFHVIYKDANDPNQHIDAKRIVNIIENVNTYFSGKRSISSENLNMRFIPAKHDPKGNILETPGVDYVKWDGVYPINYEDIMYDKTRKYTKYIWDPNKYINVMFYNFDSSKNGNLLGLTHLPFTTTGDNELAGLSKTDYSKIAFSNLTFAYCSSINSTYAFTQSTATEYNTRDIYITTAHELGHYLGLHHVFAEDKDGNLSDSCIDSDYCEDTPSYNRAEYEDYVTNVVSKDDKLYTLENLLKRTNCENTTFMSSNVMDYSVSKSCDFTADQKKRVRNVLTYSPLIPGAKRTAYKTRAPSFDEAVDLHPVTRH